MNHRDGTKLRRDNNMAAGGRHGVSLHHAVEGMWPTPVANDDNKSVAAHLAMKDRMGGNRTAITSLQVALKDATSEAPARTWPTPRHEGSDAGGHRGAADLLHSAVKGMLPTPKSRDFRSGKGDAAAGRHAPDLNVVAEQAVGGKLSPSFVESLMGFPLGFTLPEGDPLHIDPDWGGDPMAAFGRGLEYREPLTVAHAEQRVARLKALGNAVCPQIPYVIFQAIEQAERECADGGH